MAMSDSLADMLTRMRNANMAGHRTVDVPTSKLKINVLAVFAREGFINGYQAVDSTAYPITRIFLKYYRHEPVIRHIQRISTPGLRKYIQARDLRIVRGGMGMSVLSTPNGILTDREAKQQNVGGELLLEVW